MKKIASILLISSTSAVISICITADFLPRNLVHDYNEMAQDNFKTALVISRYNYHNNRVIIFCESENTKHIKLGDITLQIIPASQTTNKYKNVDFNNWIGNSAAHINSFAIMLACKWIEDGNPVGNELLKILKENIPSYKLSSPSIPIISVSELSAGSKMMKSEARQWDWRMNGSSKNRTNLP